MGQVSIPPMLFSLRVRMVDINTNDLRIGLFVALSAPLSGLTIALSISQILNSTPLQMSIFLFSQFFH